MNPFKFLMPKKGKEVNMFSLEAIIKQNIAVAAQHEEFINNRNQEDYKTRFESWLLNEPIRASMKMQPYPEPEPPLRYYATFDTANLVLVTMEGPERLDRIPMPEPEPVPVGESLPGEPWPNRPYRHMRANDKSEPPFSVQFEGKTWERINIPSPFGSPTKLWQVKA